MHRGQGEPRLTLTARRATSTRSATSEAARAIEILTDNDLRVRMGRHARERALDRFEEEKIVPRYRAMYEGVITR